MAKTVKKCIDVLLVKAELTGRLERRRLKGRHLVCVDLIWPRSSIAKKSAAREAVFRKGVSDFSQEPWAKRVLFREDVEGYTAFAVSVTETVTLQKLRRFARLTAKYAFRMGADFMEKGMVGYADIASAPIDALSAMVGEKDAPKAIAQGVLDLSVLPPDGEETVAVVSLKDPESGDPAGMLTLLVRG